MSQELHYTSAPRGLKPGSRGFCTVAHSVGLSQSLLERLEGLSGYRPRFKPNDPSEPLNPVVWSHVRLTGAGPVVSVLSRIGPAGLDYTGRENKHAHHVVLDADERPAGGPAWLLTRPGFMQSSWSDAPQTLPAGRPVPAGDQPPSVCHAWATQAGDSGWAGVVAESFLTDPKRTAVIVYDPGADVLALFSEALALLPPDRRWEVTFSTYFTGTAPGLTCCWRGVLRDTPEERQARSNPETMLIDLGRPAGEARGGALVIQARTGEQISDPPFSTSSPEPAEIPARLPSQKATPTTSRAGLSPPVPDPMFNADDDPTATPPPSPRRRTTPSTSVSTRGWSARSVVCTSAMTFALGLTLGGAGVAIYLRGQPLSPGVEFAIASPPEEDATPSAPTEPNPGETHTGGSIEQTAPRESQKVDASKRRPPVEESTKHNPSNTSQKFPATAPAHSPDRPQTKQTDRSTQPPQPTKAVVRKLVIFPIPLGNHDPLLGTGPSTIAEQPVEGLKLIGGEEPEQSMFRFKAAAVNGKQGVIEVSKKGQADQDEPLGTFTAKGKEITFEWLPTNSNPHLMEIRSNFLNCILEVNHGNDKLSYYYLRRLDKSKLPTSLGDIPKKVYHFDANSNTAYVDVTWCVDEKNDSSISSQSRRARNLSALFLHPSGGTPLIFTRDDNKKHNAKIAPADATLSVELSPLDSGRLRFAFAPMPRSESAKKQLDTKHAAARELLRKHKRDLNFNTQGDWEAKEITNQQNIVRECEEEEKQDKHRRIAFDLVQTAHIEALITVKADGIEFELARIIINGNGKAIKKGGER